jgi:hypothetical protein
MILNQGLGRPGDSLAGVDVTSVTPPSCLIDPPAIMLASVEETVQGALERPLSGAGADRKSAEGSVAAAAAVKASGRHQTTPAIGVADTPDGFYLSDFDDSHCGRRRACCSGELHY